MTKEALTSSIEFLERVVLIGGVLVAIGVVIESAIGIVLFKKGHQLRKMQEADELALRLKIEDTRERAASLEKQAEDLRKANDDLLIETFILKRPVWQSFDGNSFVDALKGKPKANVVILFWPNDQGSSEMAGNLMVGFTRAEWPISEFRVFNTNEIRTGGNMNIAQGAMVFGLGVRELKVMFNTSFLPQGLANESTPVGALLRALSEAQIVAGKPRQLFVNGWLPDSNVPTNTLRLLVGQGF